MGTGDGLYQGSKVLLYGIAGGGKTTACITLAINAIAAGKRVLYIDADYDGTHPLKLQALYKKIYNMDFKPTQFKTANQHAETMRKLWKSKGLEFVLASSTIEMDDVIARAKRAKTKYDVIVVDSVSQYYRVNTLKANDFTPAQMMTKFLDNLLKYARGLNATVLMTAQRVSDIKMTLNDKLDMYFRDFVGGELLHHIVDNILELQILRDNKRRAIVRKYRNPIAKTEHIFEIRDGMI